jgi:ADP-ribose pyrophosphatase
MENKMKSEIGMRPATSSVESKSKNKESGFYQGGISKILQNLSSESDGSYPVLPRVAVGAVVFKDNRVLLVRRGKPPAENLWAIPGGRVEIGETLQEASEREILEETGITIRALEPVYTFDVINRDENGRLRFHYVIVDLTADYIRGEPRAGDDATGARWVSSDELASLKVSSKTRQLLKAQFDFGN